MWLESEENKGFVEPPEAIYATINNENRINKRRSWREGVSLWYLMNQHY